jgi:hypothetical protein
MGLGLNAAEANMLKLVRRPMIHRSRKTCLTGLAKRFRTSGANHETTALRSTSKPRHRINRSRKHWKLTKDWQITKMQTTIQIK